MFNFFFQGGFFVYFLYIFAIIIGSLSIKKAIDLFGKKSLSKHQLNNGLNAIIFWGAMSLLIGFIAHFYGLYMATSGISHAQDISPVIVAEAYGYSLSTILTGLFLFMVSYIVWFIFRWRLKKLST